MKRNNIILSLIFLGSIIIDQITKILITSSLQLNEGMEIIKGFFSLTYVQNTGAAWSMLEGKMLFFYVITVVAIVVLVLYFRTLREYQFYSKIGIVLMIGGTLGNFIDRLAFQYVRDFLDFIIFGYNFPIFNVADMCLCIGIGCIIIDELMDHYGLGKKWNKKNI